jgi:hypothetical protein
VASRDRTRSPSSISSGIFSSSVARSHFNRVCKSRFQAGVCGRPRNSNKRHRISIFLPFLSDPPALEVADFSPQFPTRKLGPVSSPLIWICATAFPHVADKFANENRARLYREIKSQKSEYHTRTFSSISVSHDYIRNRMF